MPFPASSSSAVSIVFWTVSSMLFLLSFLAFMDAGARGCVIPDESEDGLRAATALGALPAGDVDVARATGAIADESPDLHVAQRIAEADVHGPRPQADWPWAERGS